MEFIGKILHRYRQPLDDEVLTNDRAVKYDSPDKQRFLFAAVIYCYAESCFQSFLGAIQAKLENIRDGYDHYNGDSAFIRAKILASRERATQELGFLSDGSYLGASINEPSTQDPVLKIYILRMNIDAYRKVEGFREANGLNRMPEHDRVQESFKVSKANHVKCIHAEYPVENIDFDRFYTILQIINHTDFQMTIFCGLAGSNTQKPGKAIKDLEPHSAYTGYIDAGWVPARTFAGCIYLYMDGIRRPHESPHSDEARKFGFALSQPTMGGIWAVSANLIDATNMPDRTEAASKCLDGVNNIKYGPFSYCTEKRINNNLPKPIFWNKPATSGSNKKYFRGQCDIHFIRMPPSPPPKPVDPTLYRFTFQQYDPTRDMTE